MRWLGVLVAPLIGAVACSSPTPSNQPPTAGSETVPVLFEGARLVIGDESAPIENSAFIVEGGKIGKVGRKGEIGLPAGAVRVDLTGKTVMPALVSAHVHIGLLDGVSVGPDTTRTRRPSNTCSDTRTTCSVPPGSTSRRPLPVFSPIA